MSEVQKRLATDQSLQSTNTALGLLAKNATLVDIKTALGLLAKDGTINDIKTAVGLLAQNTTLQATNTALGLLAKDATLIGSNALLEAIANILISVRSVNGEYGVVVLDSGDILINKNVVSSKTVEEVLSELEDAVENTPLTFTPTLISGDDYNLVVTVGSP